MNDETRQLMGAAVMLAALGTRIPAAPDALSFAGNDWRAGLAQQDPGKFRILRLGGRTQVIPPAGLG
jgi:hypothetical protein